MNAGKIICSILLLASSGTSAGDVISVVCTTPGRDDDHRIVIDTGQMAVRHDASDGIVGYLEGDNIHYYVKDGRNIIAYRLNLSDLALDRAASKTPPEVGYDRGKLTCRRR